MNRKVLLFSILPDIVKRWISSCYIPYRKIIESTYASLYEKLDRGEDDTLRAVYLTGFPRSGTTVMKYYFSQYPGLVMQPFDPAGFQVTWGAVRRGNNTAILVDKSNHYVQSPWNIFRGCGSRAAICCMVRDPRDSLLSLLSFPEAREVPRDTRFWSYWHRTYRGFLNFAEHSPFGNRVFFLRFEDFSANPCEAKAAYLSWLGLNTKIETIDDTYELPETQESILDKVHLWSKINNEPAERWRRTAVSEKVERLLAGWRDNRQAAVLMKELGYGDDALEPCQLNPINFNVFRHNA